MGMSSDGGYSHFYSFFLYSKGVCPVCWRKNRTNEDDVWKFILSEISCMLRCVLRKKRLASMIVASFIHSCMDCPVVFLTAVVRYFEVIHNFSA